MRPGVPRTASTFAQKEKNPAMRPKTVYAESEKFLRNASVIVRSLRVAVCVGGFELRVEVDVVENSCSA